MASFQVFSRAASTVVRDTNYDECVFLYSEHVQMVPRDQQKHYRFFLLRFTRVEFS